MLSIPRYEHWAMLMENLLRSNEWWNLIEEGIIEPPRGTMLNGQQRTEAAELKLKDLKVKNYLFTAIDKVTLKEITVKSSSKDLWDSMKAKFQGNERVQSAQLQRMQREFEILEMKNGENVKAYLSRVMTAANDMRNLGEDMPDAKVVEKVLRTLSERFTYVVCAIEELKDIKKLSVDELQASLLVHEQKFKKKEHEDHVLQTTEEPGRGQ